MTNFNATGDDRYTFGEAMNDLHWIPPSNVNDRTEGEYIDEFNGLTLEPIRRLNEEEVKLHIVEVDRMSENGNPIIELYGTQTYALDRGEPGERYLAQDLGTRFMAISKVIE